MCQRRTSDGEGQGFDSCSFVCFVGEIPRENARKKTTNADIALRKTQSSIPAFIILPSSFCRSGSSQCGAGSWGQDDATRFIDRREISLPLHRPAETRLVFSVPRWLRGDQPGLFLLPPIPQATKPVNHEDTETQSSIPAFIILPSSSCRSGSSRRRRDESARANPDGRFQILSSQFSIWVVKAPAFTGPPQGMFTRRRRRRSPHSLRSASTGRSRAARHAGSSPASVEITIAATTVRIRSAGSVCAGRSVNW